MVHHEQWYDRDTTRPANPQPSASLRPSAFRSSGSPSSLLASLSVHRLGGTLIDIIPLRLLLYWARTDAADPEKCSFERRWGAPDSLHAESCVHWKNVRTRSLLLHKPHNNHASFPTRGSARHQCQTPWLSGDRPSWNAIQRDHVTLPILPHPRQQLTVLTFGDIILRMGRERF